MIQNPLQHEDWSNTFYGSFYTSYLVSNNTDDFVEGHKYPTIPWTREVTLAVQNSIMTTDWKHKMFILRVRKHWLFWNTVSVVSLITFLVTYLLFVKCRILRGAWWFKPNTGRFNIQYLTNMLQTKVKSFSGSNQKLLLKSHVFKPIDHQTFGRKESTINYKTHIYNWGHNHFKYHIQVILTW